MVATCGLTRTEKSMHVYIITFPQLMVPYPWTQPVMGKIYLKIIPERSKKQNLNLRMPATIYIQFKVY